MERTRTDGTLAVDWRSSDGPELSPTLLVALDAFYENGYHGTSVRDIARRVGVTVPALYYHHENKQAILVALLDHSILAITEQCRAALAAAGDEPAKRFANLIECLVLYMAHHRKNAAMDAEIRALSPEHRTRYAAQRRVVEDMLTAAVKDGVDIGVFSVAVPRDTSRALLGIIQAIATWYVPGGRVTPKALARSYLDIAWHTAGALPG
jgi:AcrR family transcriptional regulator